MTITPKAGLSLADISFLDQAVVREGAPWLEGLAIEHIAKVLAEDVSAGWRFVSRMFSGEELTSSSDVEVVRGVLMLLPDLLLLDARILLLVDPRQRRQGIGRTMLLKAIEVASETGKLQTLSVVWSPEDRGFYEKYGFRPVEYSPELLELTLKSE